MNQYERAVEEARARGMSPPTPEHAAAFLRDVDAGFAPPRRDTPTGDETDEES